MSLTEYGVKSSWTNEDLEDMQKRMKVSQLLMDSKIGQKYIDRRNQRFAPPQDVNINYLPIGLKVGVENLPLPVVVIEEAIRRSKHRVITRTCTCRHANKCEHFDMEIGCIHLGESTWEESDELAYHATVEETIAHLHKAVGLGLMPYYGHFALDHALWDVHPDRPFTTICLCCTCCCSIFKNFSRFTEPAKQNWYLLDGLHVAVDPHKCTGCGECVSRCLSGCIEMQDGLAVHRDADCKGCSACSVHCPTGAVSITIDDAEAAVDKLMNRIRDDVGGLDLEAYDFSRLR